MLGRVVLLVVLLLVGGGVYLFFNYEVDLKPRTSLPWDVKEPERPPSRAIRIATFSLGQLDDHKLSNRQVGDILAGVISQFDVVAVQDVRSANLGVLRRLIEQINAAGKQYTFAVCPTVQLEPVDGYSAFLFNQATIEIDGTEGFTARSVEDPAGRFRRKPLVALFRTKGPDPLEAFTFRLINVHIDPERAPVELDLLDDVYQAVRENWPDEDDVIMLGDFGVAGDEGRLKELPGVTSSLAVEATSYLTFRPIDHILYDRRATTEFTGQSAVLDLMREFKLTIQQAEAISAHLPVWAEFSPYEGGEPGRLASAKTPETR
ncbi:MAG TPA: endonuclease/exonuclease/phosphatase [Thermoguttaceae bacterium]|nr:endonuclease/exonuclease/phosphatase [Thermoguttaceae bacterium]